MEKKTIVYKKGKAYSVDEISYFLQLMALNSHKIQDLKEAKKIGLNQNQIGEMSDYDVFDKTFKLTIEIIE